MPMMSDPIIMMIFTHFFRHVHPIPDLTIKVNQLFKLTSAEIEMRRIIRSLQISSEESIARVCKIQVIFSNSLLYLRGIFLFLL